MESCYGTGLIILFCQITAERRETDPLFQGNIQVLRLNDCEGNSCAELYKNRKMPLHARMI